MEAIRQKVKIPKNRQILIKIPQHIPEDGIAEVIILLNQETKQSKLDKLKYAMTDTQFLNDLKEISEDFRSVDIAEWE